MDEKADRTKRRRRRDTCTPAESAHMMLPAKNKKQNVSKATRKLHYSSKAPKLKFKGRATIATNMIVHPTATTVNTFAAAKTATRLHVRNKQVVCTPEEAPVAL